MGSNFRLREVDECKVVLALARVVFLGVVVIVLSGDLIRGGNA